MRDRTTGTKFEPDLAGARQAPDAALKMAIAMGLTPKRGVVSKSGALVLGGIIEESSKPAPAPARTGTRRLSAADTEQARRAKLRADYQARQAERGRTRTERMKTIKRAAQALNAERFPPGVVYQNGALMLGVSKEDR